jgi:hypothetical protein
VARKVCARAYIMDPAKSRPYLAKSREVIEEVVEVDDDTIEVETN